jgi:hypothetical protein
VLRADGEVHPGGGTRRGPCGAGTRRTASPSVEVWRLLRSVLVMDDIGGGARVVLQESGRSRWTPVLLEQIARSRFLTDALGWSRWRTSSVVSGAFGERSYGFVVCAGGWPWR